MQVPIAIVPNACAGAEPVALHGDLHVIVSTQQSGAGYRVTSQTNSEDLHGAGLVSGVPYTSSQRDYSYSYYAAPLPTVERIEQVILLVPQGPLDNEYLHVEIVETVAVDGTVVPAAHDVSLSCRG
jgi:hypothetical protein